MAEPTTTETETETETSGNGGIDLGNYEIIRRRLLAQAQDLGTRAEALNVRRKETFGGTELSVVGNLRVRTENNCVPRDIVHVGGHLLFGYNVVHGLRRTQLEDVFALHRLAETEEGLDLPAIGLGGVSGFLQDERFLREFNELVEYYKDATLLQLRVNETKLLAVFQIGRTAEDVRVFRWSLDADGQPAYLDNRGERDHVFPPSHDFEWIPTTADMHVRGRHPHINIDDTIFVECIGGDLTIKIEDNTESGEGIYAEPVDNANQSLDDAQIFYARVGSLILLRILPYREQRWRHIVYNTRARKAVRIDAMGPACVQLPEDHGLIFPGGYYLQTGDFKLFDGEHGNLVFKRAIRSPNGEDVLYVFYDRGQGLYVLYPYNLVRKQVQNPIACNGFSIFEDGRMVVFRHTSDEPTRVHPMRVWQTPFVSAEHAAQAPNDGSPLARIGNADLVRGISDCFTVQRLIEASEPTRQIYEDLIANATRVTDSYFWLDNRDFGNLRELLDEIRRTAELIIDEFEKVQLLRQAAQKALKEAEDKQRELVRALRPETWDRIERFLAQMTELRNQRGHLITLRELRYMDLARLDALEAEAVAGFDKVSHACVTFLLAGKAFEPLLAELDKIFERIPEVLKATDAVPLVKKLDELNVGLNLLAEVVSGLQVDDATQRTTILEQISEVFGQLNRVRAALASHRKSLLTHEGKAEFVAQFKLFGQAVQSALALCDSPERCDDQLSRLLVQLEELEGRFSEFDEFLADLATKREEVYDAFSTRKQTLLDERNRRVQNLVGAADRIVQGVQRRARSFKADDELNTYFASDPMVHKLRQLAEQLLELGDSVKADEVQARLKSARQDALRALRDRKDLFSEGDNLIRFGRHLFSVNTQPLELTMVPREDKDGQPAMAVHLSGTDFFEPIDDPAFVETRPFWQQTVVSENKDVYRAEYLAASLLFDAESGRNGLSLQALHDAARADGNGLLDLVRRFAAERYEEGYERGLHDADATAILDKLLVLRDSAGLLRYAPTPRAIACLFWAFYDDRDVRALLHRRAQSLGRLRHSFQHSPAFAAFAGELAERIAAFVEQHHIPCGKRDPLLAGEYLFEELCAERPRFATSAEAAALKQGLFAHLDRTNTRKDFEADLATVQKDLGGCFALMRAWAEALVANHEKFHGLDTVIDEAAVVLMTERALERETTQVLTSVDVPGLLGQHARIKDQVLALRLDEFVARLGHFKHEVVPGYRRYRELRNRLVETERHRLRIDEFMPRVMTAFVRNKLINEVYLPLIGDNLAKQIGAAGEGKRTDLMGLLLLISPPGYGKTTLMEYVANRLGLVFMKINGPALGHAVHSIDPADAPNATARQEVEKVNLAFEMGNNVMLYVDDIQHTHPEFLQKFISLCDAQRRIEGVWKGRTRTYDFRGKKFAVVMAGNPYTESGEKFQIPDMLANRADTYNLGDVLSGREDAFALSYIENALTSNPVLAPLATRDYDDVYKLVRMAKGEQVPTTDLAHGYSGVELQEVLKVFQKLFVCQETLLKVNLNYILSASMDDKFRTEPRFQLQGSYRNMNKLAEKVLAAMNDQELDALVTDHYVGEAQTLSAGAEANLLKLAEIRGRLTPEQNARWEQIRRDFRRIKLMGGGEDDPVSRVTGTIGNLGDQLEAIKAAIGTAVGEMKQGGENHALQPVMRNIERSLGQMAAPKFGDPSTKQLEAIANLLGQHLPALATPKGGDTRAIDKILQGIAPALEKLARPTLDVTVQTPPGVDELLAQQVAIVERTLVPLVQTTTKNLHDGVAIARKLDELVLLLQQIDLQLQAGGRLEGIVTTTPPRAPAHHQAGPITPDTADTQKMPAIPARDE